VTNFTKSHKKVQPETLKDIAHVYMGVSPRDMHVGSKIAKPKKASTTKSQIDCWAVSLVCLDQDGAGLLPDKMERALIKESLVRHRSEQRPNFNLTINDILLSNRGNYRVIGPLIAEQRYGIKEMATPWVPAMTMMLIRMKKGYEHEAERLCFFLKSETARDMLFSGVPANKAGQQILTKGRLEDMKLPVKFFDFDAFHFFAVEEWRKEALQLRQRITKLADLRTIRAAWRHIESPFEWNFEKDEGLCDLLEEEYGSDGFAGVAALYDAVLTYPPTFPDKFIEWAKPRLAGSNIINALGVAHPISRHLSKVADTRIEIEQICPSIFELLADLASKSGHVGMIGEVSGDLVARLASDAKAEKNEITNLKIWSPRSNDIKIASERAQLIKRDFRVESDHKPRVGLLSEDDEFDYYHTIFGFVSDSSMSDAKQPIDGVSWQDTLRLLRSKGGRLVVTGNAKDIWEMCQGRGNAHLINHLEAAVLLPTVLLGSRPAQRVVALFSNKVGDEVLLIDASLAKSPNDAIVITPSVREAICSQLSGATGQLPSVRRKRQSFPYHKPWSGFMQLMERGDDLKGYSVESLTDELEWLEARLAELSEKEAKFAGEVILPVEVNPRRRPPLGD
jgi:hypothetical protein